MFCNLRKPRTVRLAPSAARPTAQSPRRPARCTSAPRAAASQSATGVVHRRGKVWARAFQRRDQAKHDARQHRNARGKQERINVHRDASRIGYIKTGINATTALVMPNRQEHASRRREHHALGQQLAEQARPPSAHRYAPGPAVACAGSTCRACPEAARRGLEVLSALSVDNLP